jgi:hypothetical protein
MVLPMLHAITGSAVRLTQVVSIDRLPRAVVTYGVSCFGCVAALLASWFMAAVDTDSSAAALVFLATVGVSGWYGGLGPALLSTGYGALAIDYFLARESTRCIRVGGTYECPHGKVGSQVGRVQATGSKPSRQIPHLPI